MSTEQITKETQTSLGPKEKNPYQPRINAIRKVIYDEDKRLREKFTWLKHQNTIGLLWFTGSLIGAGITAYGFLTGMIAWYFSIPLLAFFYSVLHELEHDLIHDMYFKEKKWLQNLMFLGIWIAKVNANPWWRKSMHLKHHKTSGQVDDIEERLIGLGQGITLKRLFVTLTPMGAYLMVWEISNDCIRLKSLPGLPKISTSLVNLPMMLPSNLCFIAFFFPGYVNPFLYSIAWTVVMVLFLPNVLRQACLQLISTGCHYYGDIPENNVYFQNQVLDHWVLVPLQAFCFNFGVTHIIHHYVTRQPFYLRQMGASAVLEEMKKQGVRFNDLEIYSRAHRYYGYKGEKAPENLAIGA